MLITEPPQLLNSLVRMREATSPGVAVIINILVNNILPSLLFIFIHPAALSLEL